MTGRRIKILICAVCVAFVAHAQDPPISGRDPFEPDDTPDMATWSGLVPLGDTSTVRRHNLHTANDVDWYAFYAGANQFLIVRTFLTFSNADTFLSLYRVLGTGEVADNPPAGCQDAAVPGPNGDQLLALACNDDVPGAVPQIRSEVRVFTTVEGFYYVKIQFSPKGKYEKADGEETTYSTQAVFDKSQGAGLLFNTYVATLKDTGSALLKNGEITLSPLGFSIDENSNGVYAVPGLPDNLYNVRATAPGFEDTLRVASLNGGEIKSDTITLNAVEIPHSADYLNGDGVLQLAEVLRVVQLYNAGALHCDGGSEDGYAPGTGNTGCEHHNSDYAPNDWEISLGEMLRLIQLYNFGGIRQCASEDGYCPK